ncbi:MULTISPECIES: phage/plasmid primase, P4 family [Enterococcus]|uniref:phage/plasmid primase, P4 family n=1 Tax=Enterococcus TaxID=1350 RepID=UPI001C8CF198|nr:MULTISPECIES: phage/plasmid primase, P4 family [Enterococcus]MBX9040716.1 hypothetical protein [Enterococcus durans]MBX9077404.1 hypothetical protein [Enterococcus durans]
MGKIEVPEDLLEDFENNPLPEVEKPSPKTMEELKWQLIERAKELKGQIGERIKEQKINAAINKELSLKKNKKRNPEEIEDEVNGRFANTFYEGNLGIDEAVTILDEFVHYVKIDDIDSPVSIFNLDDGIYTNSIGVWYRVISYILPFSKENEKNTIIHILSTRADIKNLYSSSDRIVVGNGIYNFNTKKLEPYNPDYVFTSKIATNYREFISPLEIKGWSVKKMFSDWAQGDKELELLFMQIVRASVQLKQRDQFVLLRDDEQGGTGKGTFQKLIFNLVGFENIMALSMVEMTKEHQLAGIEKAQVIIGDDNDNGVFIKEPRVIKTLTSGDPLNVNPKGQKNYSFLGCPLIIQSINGHLKTKDISQAFKDRMLFVNFTKKYRGTNEGNPDIKQDYINRSEVLESLLYEALQLEDFTNFIQPASSERLMKEFTVQNDIVADFYFEVFKKFKSARLRSDFVFKYFLEWCKGNNSPTTMKQRNFTDRMKLLIVGTDWEHSGKVELATGVYFNDDDNLQDGLTVVDENMTVAKRKTCYRNKGKELEYDKSEIDKKIKEQQDVIERIKSNRSNMKALDIETNEIELDKLKEERKRLG